MTHLALIGHGRWGKSIERTLQHFTDVSVTIVGRGEFPPRDVDGVIIATPISTHLDLALPFIERGTPTFIEKPVTASIEEVKRLRVAAEKSDTLVHVGHIHLHNPAFIQAKAMVPTLGRIRYLLFEGMNNGPFHADVSVLWDWLPHPLSMALSLLYAEPVSVQAWGINILRFQVPDLHDFGIARFEFESASLVCTVNWLSPEKRTKMTIVGEHSSLVHTDTDLQKLALYYGMGPRVDGMRVSHQVPSIEYPEYESGWPLERELRAFIDAIQAGSRDRSGLALGARIVNLIAAAHSSIQNNGQIVAC